MGVFDLFSPGFSWLDALLGEVSSPLLRLTLWGIAGSALSMWLYVRFSSQEKLAQLKLKLIETRQSLAQYDNDFKGALEITQQLLMLSLKQLGLVIGPTILASLPVLFLLLWLGTTYNYYLPTSGTLIEVKLLPSQVKPQWNPQARKGLAEGQWQIMWSTAEQPLQLYDSTGQLITTFPWSQAIPILHKRQWWNFFIGNPVGYIPKSADLEKIEIALPENKYLTFGPEWMQSSEAFFLLVMLLCSVAIKLVFRIH
jgi:hypothetical protein